MLSNRIEGKKMVGEKNIIQRNYFFCNSKNSCIFATANNELPMRK